MEFKEFWATLHACLLYDREETTVFESSESADWNAAEDAVLSFINSVDG